MALIKLDEKYKNNKHIVEVDKRYMRMQAKLVDLTDILCFAKDKKLALQILDRIELELDTWIKRYEEKEIQ